MAENPVWSPSQTGPRPSMRVCGGEDNEPAQIAADLTDYWRAKFRELPADDFPRPLWLTASKLDSIVRRGWLEGTGSVRAGKWVYRLTALGLAIKVAVEATDR